MLCFFSSSFIRSMAPSASVLMASCTWTCNTRWLPPLRSSPSRMLCFTLSIKPDRKSTRLNSSHSLHDALPICPIRLGLDGVLHVDLQHQVAAALEIQPQPDVVLHIVDQTGARLGKADDAEYAYQDRHHDNHGPARHIFSHEDSCLAMLLSCCLLLAFARHQVGNRTASYLQLDIVGFHPQHQRLVVAD